MGKRGNLRDQMREAFLAIEPHDAHVVARRLYKAVEQGVLVEASVQQRRAMSGASGVPETADDPRMKGQASTREIDNPYLTDGLYYGDNDARRQARAKITVTENALSRIGALCFIRRREKHHEHAAELFKSLYEARYGCGTPAMDASREPVDRSIVAHDSGMAGKIDRTWKLEQAERELGKPTFNRLVALLVLCIPAGEASHWRVRKASVDQVLDDLDELSTVWHLRKKAA